MPVFDYIAVNGSGKEVRGRTTADNSRAAAAGLRGQQLFVTEMREAAGDKGGKDGLNQEFDLSRWRSVKGQDIVFFFRQLSFVLRAGLPVMQALQLSRGQVSSGRLKQVISAMLADIEAGAPLSQAMAKHPDVFGTLMVNLVTAGENTGDLGGIMERIATHTEKRLALKSQILNAMIYPAVVVLAAIGVGIFLVWKIIPQFEKFLAGRGKSLPPSTQMLIDISHFLRDNGLWVIGIVVLVIAAIVLTYKSHGGRLKLDALLLKFPVLGKLLTNGAMAQMNWSLATMLGSGLTVRDGLKITSGVVGNLVISEKLKAAADLILAGRELSGSVRHPAIPDLVVQMIAVGERTGTLDHVLLELGMFYEQALQNGIKRLSAMIEPAMILVIGGMVGFVYYSFFQAMFKLAGRSMKKRFGVGRWMLLCPCVLMLWAGQPQAAGNGSGRAKAPEIAQAAPARDPFTASERMFGESGRYAANNAGGGRGFIPSMGYEQTPKMKLRGFVNNRHSVALLEIEGIGTYLVRKGDEIGLQALGKNTVIKILDVDGLSVKVQTGMINQVIVVR